MLAKFIILLAMFLIVGALGSGIIFLVKDPGNNKRTVKALTWRIGLSLSLFIFLFIAFRLGWVTPHSIG